MLKLPCAGVAGANLCIRIIRDVYTKWNGPAFKTPPRSPRLTSLAPASRQLHFLTSQVVNPPNCETERQHGTSRPLTLGVLNSLFIANGVVSSLLNATVYKKRKKKKEKKRDRQKRKKEKKRKRKKTTSDGAASLTRPSYV